MTQRGSVVLAYLIGAAAVLGALFLIYRTIESNGCDRCRQEIEARYAQRDNDQLKAAHDRIQTLQNEARAAEAKRAADLAAISSWFQGKLSAQSKQHERDLAAVRDDSLVLRDPGHTQPAANCGGSSQSQTGAPASGRDGEARAQLSDAAAGFLLGEANRADAIVNQLTACQAVITSDRGSQ